MFKLMRKIGPVQFWLIFVFCWQAGTGYSQQEARTTQLAEGPRTIDPTMFIPDPLAVEASVDLSNSSLRELVDWLQQQGLVVLLDKNELALNRVSPAEPIDDRLQEAPIYLILERLSALDIGWYFEDEILYITSSAAAESRLTTKSYNVGDLLDQGYALDDLERVITQTIAPDDWLSAGGTGVVSTLGDVLFVRQHDELQRRVEALLVALREHGRQTFVYDPEEHFALRAALNENVSLDVVDMPLESAIDRLSENAATDLRLDRRALQLLGVREREPVTAQLADRKLSTVIQALVLDLELTWILRNGVLWITSEDEANAFAKTCVYDVSDLCQSEVQTNALVAAIVAQAEPGSWSVDGGEYGDIAMARAGTVVVTHREQIQQEILELLNAFRAALESSKPRENAVDRFEEIVTVYYRLHANVAHDLAKLLPRLIAPESWKSESQPEGQAELFVVASVPELPSGTKQPPSDPFGGQKTANRAAQPISEVPAYYERAVLIVRQTRPVHGQIEEVIRRVQTGDRLAGDQGPGGGMGGMGSAGGMGGMFRIPIGYPKTEKVRSK